MITDAHKREWIYRLSNLPARPYPFPHAILADTIPPELYAEMVANIPPHATFVPLHTTGRIGKDAYPQRFVYQGGSNACAWFWSAIREFVLTPEFGMALTTPFRGKMPMRLPERWKMDTLLIEDLPGYRIGPHADAKHKVLSALFYLGEGTVGTSKWGTSIYTPKPGAEVNPSSGRHYEFEQFERITTVPYAANHGLMFVKGDASWHGVETIPAIAGERRIILLADIKLASQ